MTVAAVEGREGIARAGRRGCDGGERGQSLPYRGMESPAQDPHLTRGSTSHHELEIRMLQQP